MKNRQNITFMII